MFFAVKFVQPKMKSTSGGFQSSAITHTHTHQDFFFSPPGFQAKICLVISSTNYALHRIIRTSERYNGEASLTPINWAWKKFWQQNRTAQRSLAMAVRMAMALLRRRRRRRRRRSAGARRSPNHRQATGSPELVIPAEIEIPGVHQPLLLRREPALEEALEGGLLLGPEEEGVAGHEVHGGHIEADGFHDIPWELPECEPHEAGSLDDEVCQPQPKLTAHLERRGAVDLDLLRLHGLQLFPCWAIQGNGLRSRNRYGLLDGFDNLQWWIERTKKHFENLLGCSSSQQRTIKERAMFAREDYSHETRISFQMIKFPKGSARYNCVSNTLQMCFQK